MATGINYCQNGRLAKAKVTGHGLLAIVCKVFLKKKDIKTVRCIWLLRRHFCISRIKIDEAIASTTCVVASEERGLGEANTSGSPASDPAW